MDLADQRRQPNYDRARAKPRFEHGRIYDLDPDATPITVDPAERRIQQATLRTAINRAYLGGHQEFQLNYNFFKKLSGISPFTQQDVEAAQRVINAATAHNREQQHVAYERRRVEHKRQSGESLPDYEPGPLGATERNGIETVVARSFRVMDTLMDNKRFERSRNGVEYVEKRKTVLKKDLTDLLDSLDKLVDTESNKAEKSITLTESEFAWDAFQQVIKAVDPYETFFVVQEVGRDLNHKTVKAEIRFRPEFPGQQLDARQVQAMKLYLQDVILLMRDKLTSQHELVTLGQAAGVALDRAGKLLHRLTIGATQDVLRSNVASFDIKKRDEAQDRMTSDIESHNSFVEGLYKLPSDQLAEMMLLLRRVSRGERVDRNPLNGQSSRLLENFLRARVKEDAQYRLLFELLQSDSMDDDVRPYPLNKKLNVEAAQTLLNQIAESRARALSNTPNNVSLDTSRVIAILQESGLAIASKDKKGPGKAALAGALRVFNGEKVARKAERDSKKIERENETAHRILQEVQNFIGETHFTDTQWQNFANAAREWHNLNAAEIFSRATPHYQGKKVEMSFDPDDVAANSDFFIELANLLDLNKKTFKLKVETSVDLQTGEPVVDAFSITAKAA